MNLSFTTSSRFANVCNLSESPMIKCISRAFAALLVILSFFVSTPAFAGAAVGMSFEWKTPVAYKPGSSHIDVNGGTMVIDSSIICAKFGEMEELYGKGNIIARFGGSSDALTYSPRSLHDPLNGGLAVSRQSTIKTAVLSTCSIPDSDREDSWADEDKPVGYRYSWVRIEPKAGINRKPVMPDLPADLNERWGFAKPYMWDHYADIRPVVLQLDPYGKAVNDLTPASWDICLSWDKSEKLPGQQVHSVQAGLQLSDAHTPLAKQMAGKDWNETVEFLSSPPMGMQEIDVAGNLIARGSPEDGGIGLRFDLQKDGSLMVYWPDRCSPVLAERESARLAAQQAAEEEVRQNFLDGYRFNAVVMVSPGLEASVLGDGSSLTTHPYGTFPAEIGVEVGGLSPVAFLGTLGVGGAYDDNCNMPAAWLVQGRVGLTINRQGLIGGLIDARVQYSFAPSYSITPDDPDTAENEYAASSALGTDAVAFLVDVGPRIAFSEYGVHSGWIAPTFTAGPKLRWFDDKSGQQRVTLTGDFGATLNVGWDF